MSQDHVPSGSSAELQSAAEVTANQCFGCSVENPQGLHLVFTFDTSDPAHPRVSAPVQLTRLHEGRPDLSMAVSSRLCLMKPWAS